ncbi:MAG: response regulator [Planctomycetes bacterium]|nr:response regulator [Planctomycetota bacterium]
MTAAPLGPAPNRRVLVIDDNEAIHADFRKILTPASGPSDELLAAEAALFGDAPAQSVAPAFELTSANQGKVGYELAQQAHAGGAPFAVAFVDMRMPPGWDGLQTIEHLWRLDPDLEVVICTAFSDYSWDETVRRLGHTDRLLVVKKPFDRVEVLQVAHALTQKWNLQRQARRTLGELDALVRDRTAALESARDALLAANRDLEHARDAAEAANRSKSMFLANVSHELRTPLTAIVGYAEEAQERLAGRADLAFECDALATIHRNALHLVLVIGDLLDVSKLEAGKLQVEAIACSPRDVVRDVVHMLQAKADDKGVGLALDVATELPSAIVSDPLRLRQILLNLIDNAIKFTSTGEVRVGAAFDADRDQIVFSVRDQGCGMAPDTVQRLFRPFEQADVTTTRRYGGTGLGLVISRQLAELLGGGVTVTSEAGVGSNFTVRVAAHAPAAAAPAAGAVARADRHPDTGMASTLLPVPGTRVLVVEDGRDNQRLLTHVLRKVGVDVTLADHGAQALVKVGAPAEGRFDLVLMDIQMPVMDGLAATAALRAAGHVLPIVALSASVMHADREACNAAGCTDFLGKPIERCRLFETIARLVPNPGRPPA